MRQIRRTLEENGLSSFDARIYLALLALRESTASAVAKRARVKRSTTYVALERLIEEGIVSSSTKNGVRHFTALNPYALLDLQHRRYSDLERVMPELMGIFSREASAPKMSVFEGVEGMIRVMDDTLTASTELMAWADIRTAVDTVLKDYYPSWIKRKKERQLWSRAIFSYDRRGLEFKKRGDAEYREAYLVPAEQYPFENEIIMYDEKLAMISHSDKLAVIINSKNIVESQRSVFRMAFVYAKMIEEQTLTPADKDFLAR